MRHFLLWATVVVLIGAAGLYGVRNYGGEVAVLYTTDSSGRRFQTTLWVINHGPQVWIRSTSPTSPWLDRIINNPDVELRRGPVLKTYKATPLAHRRDRINGFIAEQYGWAEWLLAKIEDRSQAVPVFLDPFG